MSANPQTALKLLAMAGRLESAAELRFAMLNRTFLAVPHDRASLWRAEGGPKLLGVSGTDRHDAKGAFARAWTKLLRASAAGMEAKRWTSASGGETAKMLADIAPGEMHALWLPLPGTGMALAVERWNGNFSDEDAAVLADMAVGYASAWQAIGRRRRPHSGRIVGVLALAAAVAALILVRLPLRIVAPCEVVAKAPYLIATPMDGVIREVAVQPGQTVEAGQTLALYQEDIQEGDLEVARRQAEAAEAELSALTIKSLTDATLRDRVRILGARLEQERARLDLADKRLRKMRITAPAAGTALIEDPDAWRGKPVAVGEKMMWLVEPGRNQVRIWLAQSDRVDFDFARPVRVHLDAYGGELFEAKLGRVGSTARPAPTGAYAFPAEAEWLGGGRADTLLGLTGTAVLYGPEAPLWWWLLRKPVGGMRRWLGW